MIRLWLIGGGSIELDACSIESVTMLDKGAKVVYKEDGELKTIAVYDSPSRINWVLGGECDK